MSNPAGWQGWGILGGYEFLGLVKGKRVRILSFSDNSAHRWTAISIGSLQF